MSGRRTSVLTLAVALLVGTADRAAAQEQFQTPLNNGEPTSPPPPPRNNGVYVASECAAFGFVQARAVGSGMVRELLPVTHDLPRVTSGGFGSYCAVLLPRSVVPAPRRMLVVCDEKGRMHLTAVADVLVPSPVVTAAPLPTAPPEQKQVFNFVLGQFGSGPRDCAPACPTGDSPRVSPPVSATTDLPLPPTPPGVVVPFADYKPSDTVSKVASNSLLGTWYRDVPAAGLQVVATFTSDELKVCVTSPVDGRMVTATVTTHYTVTPDGLMFGAVTGADVETKNGPKANSSDGDLMKLTLVAQMVADAPFSCRTKVTSAGLMVSGLKFGLPLDRSESEQLQLAFGGLFKCAKDGKVPALARVKPKADKVREVQPGSAIGAATGRPTLGSSERVGVDFNTNPPTMTPPALPSGPPVEAPPFGPPVLSKVPHLNDMYKNVGPAPAVPAAPPARPGVSEDSTKQMAQDAFGQLLRQSGTVLPAAGATLPSGGYLEHNPQQFELNPAHPVPRELANEGAVRPATAIDPCAVERFNSVAKQATAAQFDTPNSILGTWYHEAPAHGAVVAMTFTRDELQTRVTLNNEGRPFTITATASYKFTNGCVFGVITGVGVEVKGDKAEAVTEKERSDLLFNAKVVLEGTPFAFNTQVTKVGLKVYGAKCPLSAGRKESELVERTFNGQFKSVNGVKIPQPTEPKMSGFVPEAAVGSTTTSPSGPTRHVRPGIEAVAGVEGPNGEMVIGTRGVTVPSARCETYPQNTVPFDCVATQATVAPLAAPKAGPVGTWYRDIAGKQCVVKVTPDHLTLTVHDVQEIDGKVSTASLVITADYHLNRDGITATGLITSVDVNFEGDFPADDSKPFFEMLGELQQTLEDKPFALTFRTYGDALVIGSVRMPRTSDRMDVQPAGYMAGRYKVAGDKLPKPKPVKVSTEPKAFVPNGGPPLSGPSYGPTLGVPGGQLLPEPGGYRDPLLPTPPLPASNGDLLPPQQVPSTPPARVVPSGGTDSWAPAAPQPTKPVPPMPQPVPPGEVRPVSPTAPARNKETAKPAASSGAQMLQLPSRSEDLREINNEWRRFWFPDAPEFLKAVR